MIRKTISKLSILVGILSLGCCVSFLWPLKVQASGIDDFVTRCYEVALERHPEPAGFEFWKTKLSNDEMTGSMVASSFIFSDEYKGRDKTNAEFVYDLYEMYLGREPEKAGYDYWLSVLANGASRNDVIAGFANSNEFYGLCNNYGITSGYYSDDYDQSRVNDINLFVERLYKTCLGRLGDNEGQQHWVRGLLEGKIDGATCAANFIKSKEYESKELTDADYIENLYIAMMGRNSDAQGKANWLAAINDGYMTRDQVFAGFVNSKEFHSICDRYGVNCGNYSATDIKKPKAPETVVNADGSKNIYEFALGDKIIKSTYYRPDGKKESESEYDDYGRVIKDTFFLTNGKQNGWNTYEYDGQGRISRQILYGSNGKISSWLEYSYDEAQQETQIVRYDANGVVRSVEYYPARPDNKDEKTDDKKDDKNNKTNNKTNDKSKDTTKKS